MGRNEEYVYLGRLYTEESAERFSEAMEGGLDPIGEINTGGSNTLSSVAVVPDLDSLGSDVARDAARKNAENTMNRHSFFFRGDSLDAIQDAITILSKEPRDMEGFNNVDRGVESINDCFAADRTHVCLIRVRSDTFDWMCRMGLIGLGSCEYGRDFERVELDEAILGDDAIRRIIAGEGEIIAFDSPQVVYEEVFGADYDSLFSRGKRRTLRRDDDLYGYEDESEYY